MPHVMRKAFDSTVRIWMLQCATTTELAKIVLPWLNMRCRLIANQHSSSTITSAQTDRVHMSYQACTHSRPEVMTNLRWRGRCKDAVRKHRLRFPLKWCASWSHLWRNRPSACPRSPLSRLPWCPHPAWNARSIQVLESTASKRPVCECPRIGPPCLGIEAGP